MIDLEQERKAFEEQWKFLGGHLLYVEWTTDHMYSLSATANALSKSDKISLFNTINTAWGLWVVQAKQNKSVIDSLKDQLAKIESGEFVVVPKSKLDTCYWDEANNEVSYYELFDTLEEAKKAAAYYKATIEAAQENSHE
ncbi:hypothetical protein [Acinetobacter sp. 243_ASPC]|uniref:hypothetical protein n=1 Tax=Acinetobacter sp. 243_ASPC TaxID=1579345 RepID=UPI00065F78C7|nr:hypothetical protein [Acinetobacter sp. 243_ASPC]